MTKHERIIAARDIAAALAARDPVYAPVFERMKVEADRSSQAVAVAKRVVFGRRRVSKEQAA